MKLKEQALNLKSYAKSVEPILLKEEALHNVPLLVSSM